MGVEVSPLVNWVNELVQASTIVYILVKELNYDFIVLVFLKIRLW